MPFKFYYRLIKSCMPGRHFGCPILNQDCHSYLCQNFPSGTLALCHLPNSFAFFDPENFNQVIFSLSPYSLVCSVDIFKKKRNQTSLGRGYSSDSSMRTTCPILGLFSASRSTHLKAVKRARLRALVDGLVAIFGSKTSSERLLPTFILSQSTRFT